jgi:hypothetical protein
MYLVTETSLIIPQQLKLTICAFSTTQFICYIEITQPENFLNKKLAMVT